MEFIGSEHAVEIELKNQEKLQVLKLYFPGMF